MNTPRVNIPKSNFPAFKIVLCGPSRSGKINFMQSIDKHYTPEPMSKIGVDFLTKNISIDEENIKLQIWDTRGVEKFYTANPKLFKNFMSLIIIFDKSSYQSYSEVEKFYMFYKESQFKFYIIVGYTIDLEDVCFDDGRELALGLDAIYFEVALKDKNKYEMIFELIARECLNKLLCDNL